MVLFALSPAVDLPLIQTSSSVSAFSHPVLFLPGAPAHGLTDCPDTLAWGMSWVGLPGIFRPSLNSYDYVSGVWKACKPPSERPPHHARDWQQYSCFAHSDSSVSCLVADMKDVSCVACCWHHNAFLPCSEEECLMQVPLLSCRGSLSSLSRGCWRWDGFYRQAEQILVRDDSDKLSFVVPALQVHSQDSADADSGPFTQEVFRK